MLTITYRIVVAVLVMAVTLGCSSFQAHYSVPWEKKQEGPLIIIPDTSCLSGSYEVPIDYGDNPPAKKINVELINPSYQKTPAPHVPAPVPVPARKEKKPHYRQNDKQEQKEDPELFKPGGYKEGETAIASR